MASVNINFNSSTSGVISSSSSTNNKGGSSISAPYSTGELVTPSMILDSSVSNTAILGCNVNGTSLRIFCTKSRKDVPDSIVPTMMTMIGIVSLK